VPRVRVALNPKVVGRDTAAVIAALRSADPGVVVLPGCDDSFYLGPDLLQPDEDAIVLERVTYQLTGASA
jgi:hypothetical protein